MRQALGYAMDRTRIRDVVFGGKATIGQGPLSPIQEGWDPNRAVYPPTPDFVRARALLREAGIPEGKEIAFSWVAFADDILKDLGPVLQDDWAKVGLKANLQFLETGDWVTRTRKGEQYGFAVGVDFAAVAAGRDGLYYILNKGNASNRTSFDDDETTALVLKAEVTEDPKERARILADWSEMVARKGAWLSPAYPHFLAAYNKKLQGLPEWQFKVSRFDLAGARLS